MQLMEDGQLITAEPDLSSLTNRGADFVAIVRMKRGKDLVFGSIPKSQTVAAERAGRRQARSGLEDAVGRGLSQAVASACPTELGD
jgi:hypothetical protein